MYDSSRFVRLELDSAAACSQYSTQIKAKPADKPLVFAGMKQVCICMIMHGSAKSHDSSAKLAIAAAVIAIAV